MGFKESEIPLFVLLPQNIVMPTKNLCLVLVLLSQFKVTEENYFSFLYLESSLRWVQGLKRECRLRLWPPQILNRSRVYFRQEIPSNSYCEQEAGSDSPLQVWASFYLYKYLFEGVSGPLTNYGGRFWFLFVTYCSFEKSG